MSSDAARFARAVLDAFEAAGRVTDAAVHAAGGPSSTTMTKLRNAAERGGELAEPRSQTWAAIERAANWPAGSARRLWQGEEPPAQVALAVEEVEEGFVQFEITGNFGVKAIVKGPVRDLDALQEAASKLIAGMNIEAPAVERT